MAEFDPRKFPIRRIPVVALAVAGAAVFGIVGWQTAARIDHGGARLTPEAAAALQHAAFTEAEARDGYGRPRNVQVRVQRGETLERAVLRAGVAPEEAREAVGVLGRAMDTVHIKAGMAFDAAVAGADGQDRPARLIGISLRTSPVRAVTLSRTFDGALRVRAMEEKVSDETTVADGKIEGSLYESAQQLGATPTLIAQVAKLFAHKLDFQRDIQPGDDFRLIFDRKVTESGRTVETGDVEYAEIHGVKFFRFERDDGDVDYFDEMGRNIRGFLLRTPVDGARITSTFGRRKHPILGYTRAHQGVDFGAGRGTPILAAGDGVVTRASRWGGYGNWLQIRHSGGWATGYAHISRYAKGVHPGVHVRQGQVVAYVGSTGLATGPHLHYEVWRNGKRVNPIGAKVPQGTILAGAELKRFRIEKARVEQLLAQGGDMKTSEYAAAD
ncbi:MAG: peptidoglycan DD-metalloendopeptidase family protein [Phenylobacterium sp.]|uniref:M23 family metallopeptidase n=1 Tax=Phenylobacterium sp. TaxID=1871053 RepID=UPI0025FD01F1|nr:M23 family metallopeptidase [Phenylobacterium sp.]MBI1199367.1 peptidoglycan DD-metalloendopeptidase family protein [Phenylobacterium sp.]